MSGFFCFFVMIKGILMSMIQGTFLLGPFAVPRILILFILSAAAGHFLFFLLIKKDKTVFSRVTDLFTGSLIVLFFSQRLSLIATHWSSVQKTLSSILYLPGGWINFTAAGICGALYLLVKYRRKKTSAGDIKMLLLLVLLTGTAALIIHFTALKIENPGEEQSRISGDSEILLEDLSGKEVPLILTGAERTIVNFWATWCPPCRAELPELIRYEEDHDPDKVRFITVNLTSTEKSPETVLDFIRTESIELQVFLDKKGTASRVFGINSVPTTLVFDSSGTLVESRSGAVDYQWLMRAGH